jgi:hypothetical protein
MHHHLHTEIEIDAAPDVVWDVLTDLDRYPEWNPFITSADGTAEVGRQLTNRLEPPGGKAITFRPRVTEVETQKTFEWLGRLGVRGVFDGRHRFDLEPTATGTHLVHSEEITGVLVRPMRSSLDSQTKPGFEAMNAALKTRAEAIATGTVAP